MNCCHPSPVITFYPYLTGSLLISAITLGTVILTLKVFRIKNPALRYQLLFLPLVTPLLAYLFYPPLITRKYLLLSSPSLMLIRPIRFLEDPLANIIALLVSAGLLYAVFKAFFNILSTWFLRRRYLEITPEDQPQLYEILQKLIKKSGLKKISLLISSNAVPIAFAFGFFKPTLVVSQGLLKKLKLKEIEAVLAHEIGHIARRDSLSIFAAKILKDIMFYNPLSYLIFSLLTREREKATDEFGISLTKEPLTFAKSIFKIWKLLPKVKVGSKLKPVVSYLIPQGSLLKERIDSALEKMEKGSFNSNLRQRYVVPLVGVAIVLMWLFLIDIGLLSPAKLTPTIPLKKANISSLGISRSYVNLHISKNSGKEARVTVCTNSSCHSPASN